METPKIAPSWCSFRKNSMVPKTLFFKCKINIFQQKINSLQ